MPPVSVSLPPPPSIVSNPVSPVKKSIPGPPKRLYAPLTELVSVMVDPLFPAVKFATPLFEVKPVAIKLEIFVAFAVAPEETIKMSPVAKSVIKSVPEVTLKVSDAAPPTKISLKVPPVNVSTPEPPTKRNSPPAAFVISISDPVTSADVNSTVPKLIVSTDAIKSDITVPRN